MSPDTDASSSSSRSSAISEKKRNRNNFSFLLPKVSKAGIKKHAKMTIENIPTLQKNNDWAWRYAAPCATGSIKTFIHVNCAMSIPFISTTCVIELFQPNSQLYEEHGRRNEDAHHDYRSGRLRVHLDRVRLSDVSLYRVLVVLVMSRRALYPTSTL